MFILNLAAFYPELKFRLFKVHCDKERLRSDAGFNKLPA
jgi:hypothetical protein